MTSPAINLPIPNSGSTELPVKKSTKIVLNLTDDKIKEFINQINESIENNKTIKILKEITPFTKDQIKILQNIKSEIQESQFIKNVDFIIKVTNLGAKYLLGGAALSGGISFLLELLPKPPLMFFPDFVIPITWSSFLTWISIHTISIGVISKIAEISASYLKQRHIKTYLNEELTVPLKNIKKFEKHLPEVKKMILETKTLIEKYEYSEKSEEAKTTLEELAILNSKVEIWESLHLKTLNSHIHPSLKAVL